MKKKIKKLFFWDWIGISTLAIVASIGLPILSCSVNNKLKFSQDNRILTFGSKQKKYVSETSDSTDVLNFTYDSDVQGYTVTGFKSPDNIPSNYTLIIPKTYNGDHGILPVKKIVNQAFGTWGYTQDPKPGSEKIVRVDLGDVEIVGDRIFSNCPNLESVTFSENLKKLIDYSFQRCPKLQSFTIPKYKETSFKQTIERVFWQGESSLKANPEKIIILCSNANISDYLVYDTVDLSEVQFYILNPGIFTDLKGRLKSAHHTLTDSNFHQITIVGNEDEFLVYESETGKQLIGLNTLAKNKTELIIPSNVNSIDKYSFQECSKNLKWINFPKETSVTYIDQKAFVGVPDATKYRVNVSDPNSPTRYALKRALGSSADQKMLIYEDNGDFVIQGHSISTAPDELVKLTENARSKNELFVPKCVSKINEDAFKNCSPNLKCVTFERGINLTNINQNTFDDVPSGTVFCVSDEIIAKDLHSKSNIDPERICYPSKNKDFIFYKNLNNHLELEHLTEAGKKSTKLTISKDIVSIKKNAFSEHLNELNSITFEDGSKISNIADDVFKNIPASTLYYVNDEGLAQTLLERNDIRKENIYTLPKNGTSFIRAKEWLNQKRSILGLTENGRKESTLTIADTDRIQTNALSDSSPNLKRIIFQGDNIGFDPNALKGVNEHTVYYVDSNNSECATINGLKQQGKVDATKIYLQKENEQDISVRSRLDHKSKTLVGLSPNGLVKNELTIPSDINRIDSEAFRNVTNPINKITFSQNIKLNHIGNDAFKNEKFKNTQYIFHSSDVSTAKILNQNGVNGHQIILKSDQYNISLSGILTEIKSGSNSEIKNLTSLAIPKKINGIDVTGVGPNAFNHCLNVTQIEFDNAIVLDKSKIDPNAFSKFNASKTLLYVYNSISASALSEVSSLTVGIANGDFFNEYHSQSKMIGLTSSGRSKTKLEVPSNIIDLKQYAFLGCSSKLEEIYIGGNNINLDDDPFSLIPQILLKKVLFYVTNDYVKNRLVKKHIPAKNIHLFASKRKKSHTAVGIAIGSILLAILLLGLGTVLPMRKQHKINLLQAKLNEKRIDNSSVTNAMALKKVVEVTGDISQQVNKLNGKMNLLNSVVSNVAKVPDYPKSSTQSTILVSSSKLNSNGLITKQQLEH